MLHPTFGNQSYGALVTEVRSAETYLRTKQTTETETETYM
jgi:hypothetical protein